MTQAYDDVSRVLSVKVYPRSDAGRIVQALMDLDAHGVKGP